jgi:H/ACA ribonucleoprotein complex subunit 4
MQELRRTRVGPFVEDKSLVTLHDISYLFSLWQETEDESFLRKFISPMEKALELLPKVYVRDSAVDALCHGAHLTAPGVLSLDAGIRIGDTVVVFTQKGEAVNLAKAVVSSEKILKMDHGFVAKTLRVIMPRGIYPKKWRSSQ